MTSAGQLKIGDFGSARMMSDATASSKVSTHAHLAKPSAPAAAASADRGAQSANQPSQRLPGGGRGVIGPLLPRRACSQVSCTPAFQPPEALTNPGQEDPHSADVWALGVCLYCFIFGRLPFTGSCLLDISNAIRNDEVRSAGGRPPSPACTCRVINTARAHIAASGVQACLCVARCLPFRPCLLQVRFPPEAPISAELQDLFQRVLDKEPSTRLTLLGVMEHAWVTDRGAAPLPSLRSLAAPPKMIEVSRNEAQAAIDRGSVVSMIRARLKEKTFTPGEVLFQ